MQARNFIFICIAMIASCSTPEKRDSQGIVYLNDHQRDTTSIVIPDSSFNPHQGDTNCLVKARIEKVESLKYDSDVGQMTQISAFNVETTANSVDIAPVERAGIQVNQNQPQVKKPSRFVLINFENDIFTNTDYYYTNGVKIWLINPSIGRFRISYILPGLGRSSVDQFGLTIQQKLFTPVNPEAINIDPVDRPFAGLLFWSFNRESVDHDKKLRLSSEIVFGIVGPYSFGERVQSGVHKLEPRGWDFQVKNDLLINLNVTLEKGLISNPSFEITAQSGFRVGTMQSQLNAGVIVNMGKIYSDMSRFGTNLLSDNHQNSFYYWFYIYPSVHAVFHDISLNGGWINSGSPHTFTFNQTKRIVADVEAGFTFSYREFYTKCYLNYISPEFDLGRDHRWGGISIGYAY